jgi:hypothetical protein
MLGRDLDGDIARCALGPGNRLAVGPEALDMERDCFPNQFLDFFGTVSGRDTAREIGHKRRIGIL